MQGLELALGPVQLVVDVTSWYDEEQLRLVKGTN
jgi:hypothetical protein